MSSEENWLLPPEYAALGGRFCAGQAGAPAPAPRMLYWNAALAEQSGWPAAAEPDPNLLCGARAPAHGEGYATAYAGHQFGHFVPQLGDGRALLLGDLQLPAGRAELQLKGSGRTPFSRGGDGKAALGPVLREVIVAESMHALGVPSTRSLAAVATGDHVMREAGPQPAAVLARVARSHVRVGTFEYFAARRDLPSLRALTDWVIDRHDPDCRQAEIPPLALLERVCARQADLVARWLSIGFVHGVMNTDNMALSGETIDYGPCAFLDEYQSNKVFSSIDRGGRYAFSNQPAIAQWNLARLAECLLPLIDADEERAIALGRAPIDDFPRQFQQAWLVHIGLKLGFQSPVDDDQALIQDLLATLEREQLDYTLSFRQLAHLLDSAHWPEALPPLPADVLEAWLPRWRQRLAAQGTTPEAAARRMRSSNPAVIPRNHRIEAAIAAATGGDFQSFNNLLAACLRPFDDGPEQLDWMRPPKPAERVLQTFCGT
ncbi:protein adenylyltransferase SelO [Pseudomarimonas salicorniae]|uniref:Protein nucleotidyltransferase YdiU n=1 Tax=Pseudomarimonas salicorniae TaxID=2933270 RepID=A0ABT0GIK6_9GAMM|nr:YdiU family protein [Lysobacter sp. CAU 1642]MCK7594379.1 YdiU family protein [Lysobacter sp. CAU 1642]